MKSSDGRNSSTAPPDGLLPLLSLGHVVETAGEKRVTLSKDLSKIPSFSHSLRHTSKCDITTINDLPTGDEKAALFSFSDVSRLVKRCGDEDPTS